MIQGGDFRGSSKRGMRLRRATFAALMMTSGLAMAGMTAPAYAQQATRNFDIAAQPLADALTAFGQQSGLQVSAQAPLVEGRTSSAVRGALPPLSALSQLLTGTGLSFRVVGSTVTLESAPQSAEGAVQLGPVRVEGASGSGGSGLSYSADDLVTEGTKSYTTRATTAGTRLPLSLRETPQSVTIVTRERMDDQNLTSLEDVLRNTTGIVVMSTDQTHPDYYSRGFFIQEALIDGVPVNFNTGWATPDKSSMALYDRVEVVRGATGLFTESGDPGASINLVRKRASSRDLKLQLEASAGSWNDYSGMVDISAPLMAGGDVRGRAVAYYRDADSYVDRYTNSNLLLFGTVEADITSNTTLIVGGNYLKNHSDSPPYGGFSGFYTDGSRTHFPRSASISPDWAYLNIEAFSAYASIEQKLGNGWSAKASFNYEEGKHDTRLLYAAGTIDRLTGAGGEDAYTIIFAGNNTVKTRAFSIVVSGPINLLEGKHELLFGAYTRRGWGHGIRLEDSEGNSGYMYGSFSNINDYLDGYSPDEPQLGATPTRAVPFTRPTIYSAAKISLLPDLKAIVGARYSLWKTEYNGEKQNIAKITPYGGLVYNFSNNYSAYVSYTDVFKPQGARDRYGNYLDPVVGTNYEAGIKAEYFNGRLNASLAIFRLQQDNVAEQDGLYIVPGTDGERAQIARKGVKTEGIEGEISGEIAPGWNLFLGATYAKSKDRDGIKINAYLPTVTAHLFTSYRLPGAWNKLTLGGGVNWQNGTQTSAYIYIDDKELMDNIGSYAVASLMGKYDITDKIEAQVNVNNLFDKTYNTGGGWGVVVYGAPRNVNLTLRARF